MNQLKHILMGLHGENKERLNRLYTDRQVYIESVSSSEQPVEDEKIYYYLGFSFRFFGTGRRTRERMIMEIGIPLAQVCGDWREHPKKENAVVWEDEILRSVEPKIKAYMDEISNDKKDGREKAKFLVQNVTDIVLKRNGINYDEEKQQFVLRSIFVVPLVNGVTVNGKSSVKAIKEVLSRISDVLKAFDRKKLEQKLLCYRRQQTIRRWLKDNKMIAFIADGSMLPGNSRIGKIEGISQTEGNLQKMVAFQSPESLRRTIIFENGEWMEGMAVPEGITVVTGGGYQGKSTFLDALEMGIYNHLPGDGREYVISDESSVKVYAEDGRQVVNLDISPFFHSICGWDVQNFSTEHASGSVSQAANIIEAVYGQSRLLLIDEDTSATNFMIRDQKMRQIVKNEPIIPFTDRVRQLYEEKGVSTILVIGGSSEYLSCADRVLLIDQYKFYDISQDITQLLQAESGNNRKKIKIKTEEKIKAEAEKERTMETEWKKNQIRWTEHRTMKIEQTGFFVPKYVCVENGNYIYVDQYAADLTKMTAIVSKAQTTSLAYMLVKLLAEKEQETITMELIERVSAMARELQAAKLKDITVLSGYHLEPWLEEVRVIDLFHAVSRVRGVQF